MRKYKKHSILLNSVLWQMLEYLDLVTEGDTECFIKPKKIIKKFFKKINHAN